MTNDIWATINDRYIKLGEKVPYGEEYSDVVTTVNYLHNHSNYRDDLSTYADYVRQKENALIVIDAVSILDSDKPIIPINTNKITNELKNSVNFNNVTPLLYGVEVVNINSFTLQIENDFIKAYPDLKFHCVSFAKELRKELLRISHEEKRLPIFYLFNQDYPYVSSIPYPTYEKELFKPPTKTTRKPSLLEKDLETELTKWLCDNGVSAHRQVVTAKGRTDVWIPGVCFLELKRGKVTAKDFCQAMRYNSSTQRKIIIVGNDVEKDVIPTIDTYNEIVSNQAICYVPWGTVNVYLRGLLGI